MEIYIEKGVKVSVDEDIVVKAVRQYLNLPVHEKKKGGYTSKAWTKTELELLEKEHDGSWKSAKKIHRLLPHRTVRAIYLKGRK